MRVLLKDIAEAANCSQAAVSSVLRNGSGTVRFSQELAERVHKAADQLGYVSTRRRVRQTTTVKTGPMALVISKYMGEFPIFMDFVHGLQQQARTRGNSIEMLYEDDPRLTDRLSLMIRLDGLTAVVAMLWEEPRWRGVLDQSGVPFILVNPMTPESENCIMPDDAEGARNATRFIACCGRKSVIHIGVRDRHFSGPLRAKAVSETCRELGMTYDQIEDGGRLHPDTLRSKLEAGADTITTYSSDLALRVLIHLQAMGKSIGDEVAVVSMAGEARCPDLCKLTHLVIPFAEMGRVAADTAAEMAAGKRTRFASFYVPEQLMVGTSCRTLP